MFDEIVKLTRVPAFLAMLCVYSSASSAAAIWLVQSGAASDSNSAGNTLEVTGGTNLLDVYFDTEGDTSYGWDFLFNVSGTGTIGNVSGDANLGPGVRLADGGWQQLGGDFLGESGVLLAMRFEFIAGAGTAITFNGSYTGSSFTDVNVIGYPILRSVSEVPVPAPASAWLLGAALFGLGFATRKRLR